MENNSNEKVCLSARCKACDKDFTASTIFKHISHKRSCKALYSTEEIRAFRDWRRKRYQDTQRELYDPVIGKEKRLKQKN